MIITDRNRRTISGTKTQRTFFYNDPMFSMHLIKISKLVLLEVTPVLVPVHLVEAALVLGVVDVDFSGL